MRWAGALAFVLIAAGAARAGDITACGQLVGARDTGVLVADLTCPDSAAAVFVADRGTLDLAGHTLTGGGVQCLRSCTVRGGTIRQVLPPPGTVSVSGINVNTTGGGRVKFVGENLTVRECHFGIYTQARRVRLTNVDASDNLLSGIALFPNVRSVRGTNVTANGNGETGLTVEDEATVKITGFTAIGNGWGGLINDGRRTRLIDSTVTGNAWPPFPGEPTMIDIAGPCPRLTNTTCDHSYPNCGVCSGD